MVAAQRQNRTPFENHVGIWDHMVVAERDELRARYVDFGHISSVFWTHNLMLAKPKIQIEKWKTTFKVHLPVSTIDFLHTKETTFGTVHTGTGCSNMPRLCDFGRTISYGAVTGLNFVFLAALHADKKPHLVLYMTILTGNHIWYCTYRYGLQ